MSYSNKYTAQSRRNLTQEYAFQFILQRTQFEIEIQKFPQVTYIIAARARLLIWVCRRLFPYLM